MSITHKTCSECGAIFPVDWPDPIRCSHKKPGKDYRVQDKFVTTINHWVPLHRYAIKNENNWNPEEAKQFLSTWIQNIPKYTPPTCDCADSFLKMDVQWDFTSPETFFTSTIANHNLVNKKLDKPLFSVAQGYGKWRKEGNLETSPPRDKPMVDVIVPFHDGSAQYLYECVSSLLGQKHVKPVIHLIADNNCEFPKLPRNSYILGYTSPTRQGPYRLTNSLVANNYVISPYIALNDSDDISFEFRLWQQIATMRKYGYEMTSGAMQQFTEIGPNKEIIQRMDGEPIIYSGRKWDHVPYGRCVNSIRTMTTNLFKSMNGFPDQMCSVDFHFDNMCELLDVPIFWSKDILGLRRLHQQSLTNGREYSLGTKARTDSNNYVMDCLNKMKANPTIATARSFGALDKPCPIYPVNIWKRTTSVC